MPGSSGGLASRARRVFAKIADTRIDALRPDIRIGKVFSYDQPSQTAYILFPGGDRDNLVPVRFALDKIPSVSMDSTFDEDGLSADGDVVRVAGKPGAWFILDFVTGAPQSQSVSEVKAEVNVAWKRESYSANGPGDHFFDLEKLPIVNSEALYWNGLFQEPSNWTRTSKTLYVKDSAGALVEDDVLEFCYAYQELEFEPEITHDFVPLLGYTEWRGGSMASGPHPLPAAAEPGDLLVVAASSGSNPQFSDRRLTNSIRWGTQQVIYWGYEDDLGGPLDNNLEGMGASIVCAAYRGVRVDSTAINDTAPEYSYDTAPNPPMYGSMALCVIQTRNAFSSAGAITNTGEQGWSRDAGSADFKERNDIWSWVSKEGDTNAPIGLWKSDVSSKGTIRIAIFKLRAT